MSVENPLWGAPRIHAELLKLGFEVAQSSVAKYVVKRRGPRSQGVALSAATRAAAMSTKKREVVCLVFLTKQTPPERNMIARRRWYFRGRLTQMPAP
jgi:hypothetical protein